MADAPKEEKSVNLLVEGIAILVILYVLGIIIVRLNSYLAYYGHVSYAAIDAYFHTHIVPAIEIFFAVAGALALWGIVVAYGKIMKIRKEERAMYDGAAPVENGSDAAPVLKNERWERIISHLNSANSADWRLAIIEADVMLDELLKTQGFHGDSLGERLKSVDKSDMTTLDNAWEAHRVRNQIAHQGADYPLSEREAKRAVSLYESVFREFKII